MQDDGTEDVGASAADGADAAAGIESIGVDSEQGHSDHDPNPKEEDSTVLEKLGRGFRNVFVKQFRLYFLCECGGHTKSTDIDNRSSPTNNSNSVTDIGSSTDSGGAKPKHEVHIARHNGYDLDHPTELVGKYGTYVPTILQMLRHGVTTVGVVVLEITLLWEATLQDLQDLKDAIQHSNVVQLKLTGGGGQGSFSDILNRARRSDPIIQLMAAGKIGALSLYDNGGFQERIIYLHIRMLDFGQSRLLTKELKRLVSLISASPLLSYLVLQVLDLDEAAEIVQ
ncbi:hypothetical protein EC957_011553 [Mortierella hygrophila]|uniref:Uncharacterized protein n=1 Tax=Mortierella hygrophila TaxID=979708 RepID=A0A9P6F9D6_9FUNG|nr:hypothetical protein EC957_011553 [Mortierella hygrophila]